jgi:kynurenine formamidase
MRAGAAGGGDLRMDRDDRARHNRVTVRGTAMAAATERENRGGNRTMDLKVGNQAIRDASDKLKNWGRWGADDQIGTLNHVTAGDIVRAASLICSGKVFALGIPLDRGGPQTGLFGGRWNPIHTMLATGTDAVAGRQDVVPNIRYADDAINMPVQCATHWDSLGHIFYEEKMYNGFDARVVDCNGLGKLGIEHTRSKMVGRGVLLDIARHKGVPHLKDGEGISNDDLDRCAKAQNIEIRRGDFVILRTGQMERCLEEKKWGGFAGGDAPGVKFENCYWCQEKQIAAICSDTWGVEVRPNETTEANQPWHWVVIPAMGLTLGGDTRHGADHGRDVLSQGSGRGLRHRRHLRVLLLRSALGDHRRHRLADQSAGDQIGRIQALLRGCPCALCSFSCRPCSHP